MRHLLFSLLLILPCPVLACAQEEVPGWPAMSGSALPVVYVVDETGTETTGRLLRIDPDSVVILSGGAERRFEAARVRRIQKRGDSLRNGAIIGTGVGLALGILAAGLSDCPSTGRDGCPGLRLTAFLTSVGLYAAVGTGLDAAVVGRTTLYDQPTPGRTVPSGATRWRPALLLSVSF